MEDYNKFDIEYIHNYFCNIMDVEPFSPNDLEFYIYDDIDYMKRMKEVGISPEEVGVSNYKIFKNGHIELYLNNDLFEENPIFATEIILSQLIEIYSPAIETFTYALETAEKAPFFLKTRDGYNVWFTFTQLTLCSKISYSMFGHIEIEGNPFEEDVIVENMSNIINELKEDESDKETKFSTLLYALAKFASLEECLSKEYTNLLTAMNAKHRNMNEIIDGDISGLINELYSALIKSTIRQVNISDYMKLTSLKKKTINMI